MLFDAATWCAGTSRIGLLGSLSVALYLGLVPGAAAQPAGYVIPFHISSSRSSELQLLNLATGDPILSTPTVFDGQALALALAPSGDLFVLVRGTPEILLHLHSRSGRVDYRVPLDRDLFRYAGDLALDEDGDLWLSTGRALYRLDPWTGETTLVAETDGWLGAIAVWQGSLLGILDQFVEAPEPEKNHSVMSLVEIDRLNGRFTVRQSLAHLSARAEHSGNDGIFMSADAMDFDASGNLWVLATVVFAGVTLPTDSHSVFRVDLRSGRITETRVSSFYGLAIPRDRSAGVAAGIPTLDAVGLVALGVALLAAIIAVHRFRILPWSGSPR